VNHAIGGGYLFRNNIFEVPEVATTPLKIYQIFKASAVSRMTVAGLFIDHIYDDILSLSRID
jgi:hypothetical protein